MILVYVGNNQTFNCKPFSFRKMIPSYIPDDYVAMLPESDFVKYNKSKEYGKGSILVIMPTDLKYILASHAVLKQIKSGFPTCSIDIVSSEAYSCVMPPFGKLLNGYNPRDNINYYKTFDLSKRNRAINDRMAPVNLGVMSYEEILTQGINFWSKGDEIESTLLKIAKKKSKYDICLHKARLLPKAISESLIGEINKRGYNLKVIEGYDIKKMSEYVSLLNNTSLNIFTEENALVNLSAVLSANTFYFIPRRAVPEDRQLERYETCKMAYPESYNHVSIEKVVDKIEGMFNLKQPIDIEEVVINESFVKEEIENVEKTSRKRKRKGKKTIRTTED